MTPPGELLHSGCFFGTCSACKATIPGYPASSQMVAPLRPPAPGASHPSTSRLLLTMKRHGKRRLVLLGILATLRQGKSVVYAVAPTENGPHAFGAEEERLRSELAAEGASPEELRHFAVWDPMEDD